MDTSILVGAIIVLGAIGILALGVVILKHTDV